MGTFFSWYGHSYRQCHIHLIVFALCICSHCGCQEAESNVMRLWSVIAVSMLSIFCPEPSLHSELVNRMRDMEWRSAGRWGLSLFFLLPADFCSDCPLNVPDRAYLGGCQGKWPWSVLMAQNQLPLRSMCIDAVGKSGESSELTVDTPCGVGDNVGWKGHYLKWGSVIMQIPRREFLVQSKKNVESNCLALV